MKKPLLLCALLLSGCCTTRLVSKADTIRTERHYKTENITRRDTVIDIPLPQESISIVSAPIDSISVIETSLAVSEVRFGANGTFIHTLRNKPDTLRVNATLYDTTKIVCDSIVATKIKEISRTTAMPVFLGG